MAAPEMPYSRPSAPGRTAATARRFTLTAGAAAPAPPAVLRLLLSAPPACVRSACGAQQMECLDLFQCVRVCLPKVTVASRTPPKSKKARCLSLLCTAQTQACLHMPALAHCVGVSAMAALHSWDGTCLGKQCRDTGPGGGWVAPTTQQSMAGGEASRELAAFDQCLRGKRTALLK